MSNELQRVGLVFKEDGAADFRKSLQNVNAELQKNYNEYKKTQAQWDESTKKTEKLKYQIDNLNNAYELQKDKVTILKAQLEELENSENQNTTAINKKRAELGKAEVKVIEYEKKIKDLSNQLKISGKEITDFGEKITKAGNKIEEAGQKLSVFSGATITALGLSAKAGIDFEDAFTGVEKTVDATDEQLEEMKGQIRELAKEMPATTTEISAVAESAGQLGIKTEDIMSFTKVMLDLGNSTNLSAEEAASALAKFANVTKMSAENYSNLGATIVDLGNNFATTEADIVEMSTRLAATGELAGLSEAEILALATAMSSVGIEAEAGGSAMSKLLKQIQVAVETGSDDLKDFANVAGMTSSEFKKAFEKDAVKALASFISGLNDTERNGKSAISILEDMGLTEVRLSNTILSLSNASGVLNDAIDVANTAWEDNTALTNEANKRYGTLQSQITMTLNKIKDMAISIGNKLMPSIQKILEKVGEWVKKFEDLNEEQVDLIVKIGLIVSAIGPAVTIIGKLTTAIGGVVKAIGTVKTAIEVMQGLTTSTSTAVNGLASVFSAITSPIGIAVTGIVASISLISTAVQSMSKDTSEAFSNMGTAASDFVTGIDSAKSHLDSFNSELFASAEEQQELKNNMKEVQDGITSICKQAADERRGYTQEEITQLDEYFQKLRELNEREVQIQQEISNAITQQAETNAQTFQGSLEEYKIQSQEWIKTATEQKEKTIEIINQQSIEEVALLNQRYATEDLRQTEEYQKQYNKIIEQKNQKIAAANDEVAQVTAAYANGYLERSNQENNWYNTLKEYTDKQDSMLEAHNTKIQQIKDGELWYVTNKNQAIRNENDTFAFHQQETWNEMYENMDENQEKQLGVWLAMVAQTEMYGGEIDDETKEMVDSILASYDKMPKETKEAMKNAMEPMLQEMENKEPTLFAKASGIANGILNRLRTAFDIHSPSRKTRKIMQNVMSPMEEEMEIGKEKLFNEADELTIGMNERLNNISGNVELNSKTNRNGQTGKYRAQYQEDNNYINYDKLFTIFLKALNSCKIQLDEDGFIRFIRNELYEVI